KRGGLREDFFYRIHILPVYLPPLRERKDDIPLLIDYFLHLYDKKHHPLPGNIIEALQNYDWPGNVRELQNVLHRYLTLKRLDFAGLPAVLPAQAEIGSTKDAASLNKVSAVDAVIGSRVVTAPDKRNMPKEELPMAIMTFERDHIMKVLSENKWHRHRTAAALGISRKTLFRKMQKFDLA
ncbi:MAG: helix-turn-helix domain-containing protein, partial [Smithella sp.]